MTHIVEDGSGIALANAYAGDGYVRRYLRQRNRHIEWDAATALQRDAAVIAATQYIDTRWGARLMGQRQYLSLQRPATGYLSLESNSLDTLTVTIGARVYTFVAVLSGADQVLVGASAIVSLSNLAAAVNGDAGEGTLYGAATVPHADVSAVEDGSATLLLVADAAGEAGNDIVALFSGDEDIGSFDTPTLLGGSDGVPQPLEFPRLHLHDRSGQVVVGVPEQVRQAMAEYAQRAVSSLLMPDPVIDDTGRAVVEKFEKVGPIEERTRYEEGASLSQLLRPYPAADRLLSEFVRPGGVVYRG